MYRVYNWKEGLWKNPEQEKCGQEPEDTRRAQSRQYTGEERSWRPFAHRPDEAERMLREEALKVKYCLLIMMQILAFRTGYSFGTGMFGSPH
jgi:hypothetical protein